MVLLKIRGSGLISREVRVTCHCLPWCRGQLYTTGGVAEAAGVRAGADEAPIPSRLGGAEVRVAGVDDDARGRGLRRAAPRSRPLLACPSPRPTGSGRQLVEPLPNRMRDKIDTNRDAKYQDIQRCTAM